MSQKFKEFLDSKFGTYNRFVEREFVEGLRKVTNNQVNLESLADALIEVTQTHLTNDEDKQAAEWLRNMMKTFLKEFAGPKPRCKEAIFFPSQESVQRLITYMDGSKTDMAICVFTITNNELRDAVVRAHRRGVKVRVISDDECMKQEGSDVQYFSNAGLEVMIDTDPAAHMHNKFLVIDHSVLITGSFNWTVSAVNANQENLAIINDLDLANSYYVHFDKLWSKFKPVTMTAVEAATRIQANFRGHQARRNRP